MALIQPQLRAVGVEFNAVGSSAAQVAAAKSSGTFDMCQHNGTSTDPDMLRSYYGSKYSNYLWIPEDSELNKMLLEQAKIADTAKRNELVGKIQEVLVGDGYVIPMNHQTQVVGIRKAIKGVKYNSSSFLIFADASK
jgi:peptide/nickel transport system substrate-binding protein